MDPMQNRGSNSWEIVSGVAKSFLWGHPEFEYSTATKPQRIFASVITVQGIVDNGGFSYLFENDLDGDPGYGFSAKAFKEIDALESHRAFVHALSLFGRNVPKGSERRSEEWKNIVETKRAETENLDRIMWRNSKRVIELLANYTQKVFPITNQ